MKRQDGCGETEESASDLRRLARSLQGISKAARDASLTGQFSGSRALAVRQYNSILRRLLSESRVEEDLFEPLPDSATFDEVGFAAQQLSEFIRSDDDDEPRRRFRHGGIFEASPSHVKIVGFPGNIGELGDVLREYLPDSIRQRVATTIREAVGKDRAERGGPEPPHPPHPPHAPEAGSPPRPPSDPFGMADEGTAERTRMQRELAAIGSRIAAVAGQLALPDLPPGESARMVEELGALTRAQAELTARLAATH